MNHENRDPLFEHPLPSSPEAERAILGSIILDNGQMPRIMERITTPDVFYVSSHRQIWSAMILCFEQDLSIDPIMVGEQLKAMGQTHSVSEITNLVGAGMLANVSGLVGLVLKKHMRRRMIKETSKLTFALLDEEEDTKDLLSGALDTFASLQEGSISESHNGGTLEEIAKDVTIYLDQVEAGVNPALPTGLRDLDTALGGGILPGQMIGIGALSSHGKSALLKQALHHMAKKGISSVLFSLEDSSKNLYLRMLAPDSGIARNHIGPGLDPNRLATLRKTMVNVSALPIRVYTDCRTIAQMRARLKDLERRGVKVDIVGVDYFQLVWPGASTSKGSNRTDQLEAVANGIQSGAAELGIPWLACCQFSKEGYKSERPTVESVKGGTAFHQNCDDFITLHTESAKPKGSSEYKEYREATCFLDKSRNGIPGSVVNLHFYGGLLTFVEPGVDPSQAEPSSWNENFNF